MAENEKKTPENQQENNAENPENGEQKQPLNKKILFGFIGMGAVIVALVAALIITNLGGGKKDDDTSSKTDSAASSAAEESSQEDEGSEDDISSEESSETEESESDESSESEAEDEDEEQTEGITVTYNGDNTWENSGVTMTGIEIGIKNGTKEKISDWKLVLEIEGLDSCDGWNGTYKISGNNLTITPAEYNKEIAAGGNISIGANMGTKGKLNIKSATLNGKEVTLKKGKVAQENNQQQNDQNSQNNQNDQNKELTDKDIEKLLARPSDGKQGDDWLYTDGNKIVDKDGKEVWITGVNWFGYNTGTNTFDGLWNSELVPTVKAIADHGFNLIRVPISAELINQWADGEYPQANYNNAYNPELNSMNSQQIFDYFLKLAEENGIKVMLDIHSAETNASGHTVNLWYTDKVKTEDFYSALEYMAGRYKDNDTIVAFDLKNEPHGKPYEGDAAAIWNDSKDANNWKYVAEQAASKVLAKNPNVLIMVEGTEIYPKNIKSNGDYSSTNDDDYYFNWWGGNLRGVKDYPVDLGKYQNKLVYSPHDYGPTVYEQPWFKGDYDFDSLMKDCWKDNWFYIYKNGTAPLLIGEWGGFMKDPNLKWMTYMRQLIKENHLHHTFWCFNANSGDTGGLVLDDFTTWDEEKYDFVKEVLWQESGKFVGLDHEIALGDNGITLKKAKGL